MERLDIAFFYLINQSRYPLLETILPFFTSKYAFLIFLFAFFGVILPWALRKNIITLTPAILFLISGYVISDFSCSHFLKPLFGRERPFACLEKVYYYAPEGRFIFLEKPLNKKTLSFPSCHAQNAAFLTVYTFFLRRKTLVISLPTAILIGLSRVYLGHHFPFDVLGGFFFGGILGVILGGLVKGYGRSF